MSDTYLTSGEAAEIIRLSPRTGPRFIKAGRKVLYRRADLEAWMEANTILATCQRGT